MDTIKDGVELDENTCYMLKNVNSGLYMDVCGAKAVNGTNVIQYSASKAKAEKSGDEEKPEKKTTKSTAKKTAEKKAEKTDAE